LVSYFVSCIIIFYCGWSVNWWSGPALSGPLTCEIHFPAKYIKYTFCYGKCVAEFEIYFEFIALGWLFRRKKFTCSN
jgi:hypothetical protein